MKKLLIMLTLLAVTLFPQEGQQNPNVELPDFVITGTDVLSVRKGEKVQPDFISTVSEETLKPVYPAEQLEIRDPSAPVNEISDLFDSLDYFSGRITTGAGFYTLPVAEMQYSLPFSLGNVEAFAGGKNIRSYVNNSGWYNAAARLKLNLFSPVDAEFLPGSRFSAGGGFGKSAFKFYGSPLPAEKRDISMGNLFLSYDLMSQSRGSGGFKISDDYVTIDKENFTENYLSAEGFIKLNLSSFNISVNGEYNRQKIDNTLPGSNYYIFSIRPAAGFNLSRTLRTSFGLTYSKAGDRTYTVPYAALSLRLNRYFSVFGEYAPSAKLYHAGSFLTLNRFFDVQSINNIYSEDVNFSGVLKYEYEKYFQIDGGIRYRSSENIPYFEDNGSGRFRALSVDGEIITVFANMLFHQGPYGKFYGTVELNSAKHENLATINGTQVISSDNRLPYYPEIDADLTYGYTVGILELHSSLYYSSDVYTSIPNEDKISSYIDLGAGININIDRAFSLFFEVNNLLNRTNYFWRGYKEPPLDLVGGFIYRW